MTLQKFQHTTESIKAPLSFITPISDRTPWLNVGMALKSEFGEDGYAVFAEWSAQDPKYDERKCKSTWKSIDASGGIKLGTLIKMAKDNGYIPESPTNTEPVSPEVLAQRAAERAARDAEELAAKEAAQQAAANEAQALWAQHDPEGTSPYLQKKCLDCPPHEFDVLFDRDGTLLVALRTLDGQLQNVQRILAKPTKGPEKIFLSGGRVTGLCNVLGQLDGAERILIGEGFATCLALRNATGLPVVCAFNAGNLQHVAKLVRERCPAAVIGVCGDNDQGTAQRTGKNPGREAATAAASAVGGVVVLPEDLAEGATDWCDVAQAHGLDHVNQQVMQAIDEFVKATKKSPSSKRAKQAGKAAKSSAAPETSDDEFVDPFVVTDAGVFHHGISENGKRMSPQLICGRLDVVARTRDQDGGGWGYLLEFKDPMGHAKQWAMPSRMLSGDGGEYRAALLSMGLHISPGYKLRNLLTSYLQSRRPEEFAICTDRVGWHADGRAFVLPKLTIYPREGQDNERVVFQSASAVENTFREKGTLAQWREQVGALCVGNSRLLFSVSSAFAGALLRPAQVESGIVHLRGDSSSGKTSCLKVAVSVNGGPSHLKRWRSTDNALEQTASASCDSLLCLDELAQLAPQQAGDVAYMLSNEGGKARVTHAITSRPRLQWKILVLSAGEITLAAHMAEALKRTRTGQELRFADIPADAGAGHGAWENLHGSSSGQEFSDRIVRAAANTYGAPGMAWLQWLVDRSDTLESDLQREIAAVEAEIIPPNASGQVHRVGRRFALIGVAGEMASRAGLTGWPPGQGIWAAKACLASWIAARGGTGNGEVMSILKQVRLFFEANGEARFTWWHQGASDRLAKTINKAGWRRLVTAEGVPIKSDAEHQRYLGDEISPIEAADACVDYFVQSEVFRNEVCKGYDPEMVCRVLVEHQCLVTQRVGKFVSRNRLPGTGHADVYHINNKIFSVGEW